MRLVFDRIRSGAVPAGLLLLTASLAGCGSIVAGRAVDTSAGTDTCFPATAVPPPGAAPTPVPDPIVAGRPVTLSIDGRVIGAFAVSSRLAAAAEAAAGHRLRAGTAPEPDQLTAERAAVAGLVLDSLLLCQARDDHLVPDRAAAVKAAAATVAGYEQALAQYQHRTPAPSPQATAVNGIPVVIGQTYSSPAPPLALPGGLSAEQYFNSESYIQGLERASLRGRERTAIENATPAAPAWRSIGEWMRGKLAAHHIVVTGLGDFSLADAYEALNAFLQTHT